MLMCSFGYASSDDGTSPTEPASMEEETSDDAEPEVQEAGIAGVLKDPRVQRAAIAAAKAAARAAFGEWWESQQPTLDDLLDRLGDYEDIILPDALDWVLTASNMLTAAQAHYDNMILQLNYIKLELAQLDRDLAAIRLEIAVQVIIRDDVTASPSKRRAAADKIAELEEDVTEKQQAISDKNEEMSNHMRYKVIPAKGEVDRLESSLNHGKGNLARVMEAMGALRTQIGEIRAEFTKKWNQLQADIKRIDEALGDGPTIP